jgi:hypothetical protein
MFCFLVGHIYSLNWYLILFQDSMYLSVKENIFLEIGRNISDILFILQYVV